jgi:hypothetical protein
MGANYQKAFSGAWRNLGGEILASSVHIARLDPRSGRAPTPCRDIDSDLALCAEGLQGEGSVGSAGQGACAEAHY